MYISSVAPPQASFERCRAFGDMVGQWIDSLNRRVLVIGSGGLSHDPPVPNVEQAAAKQREFLVHGHSMPHQLAREREANVLVKVREFRSEEHTSELQSLMRISYAVFCLKKKKTKKK